MTREVNECAGVGRSRCHRDGFDSRTGGAATSAGGPAARVLMVYDNTTGVRVLIQRKASIFDLRIIGPPQTHRLLYVTFSNHHLRSSS